MTRRSVWAAVPVVAPLLVFADALLGRRLLAPGDGNTYYLPLHRLVADMWRDGVFPGWDPFTFGGSPLHAVHQAAVLYPPALLHLVLPLASAHNVGVVVAFVVAGSGSYLFARRLHGDPAAAAVAGCAFGLSGLFFGHVNHVALSATAAWLPWCLWALDRLLERRSVGRAVTGGVVVAVAALAGHGQLLAFAVAVVVGYAVLLALPGRGGGGLRLIVSALVMVALGIGLAAVQVVPTVVGLAETDRSALSFEEATSFSFDLGSSALLVFPFLHGNARSEGPFTSPYEGTSTLTELSGYVGAAALVLAVVGLVLGRRDRRLVALMVIGVVSFVVALGDSTPIAHGVHALPVFGRFRSWGRYVLGVDLVVAQLAAHGVARVRSGDVGERRSAATIALCATAALAALGVVLGVTDRAAVDGSEALWALGLPVGAAVLAAAALVLTARRVPGAVALLVVLAALDPVVSFGAFFRWRTGSPTPAEAARQMAPDGVAWGPVPDAAGGIDRFVYLGEPLEALPDYPRATAAAGLRSVNGADPLAPDSYLATVGDMDYRGAIDEPEALLDERSHLLDVLRVSLVVRADPRGGHRFVTGARQPALDDAYLVARARRLDEVGARAAVRGEIDLDPRAEVVLEAPCTTCPTAAGATPPGIVGRRRWGPSSVDVSIRAESDAMLVISQAWAPGWSAEVDGRPAPVLRANGVVQAVPVPRGARTVELRFRPPGLDLGLAASATTAVGLVVAALAEWRRRQRHESNQRRVSWLGVGSSTAAHNG